MLDIQALERALAPTVEELNYVLWGVEWMTAPSGGTLRIYIDSSEGITVDDCAIVNEHIGPLLDAEDMISAAYTLEISSPGIDRPLFTIEQYQQYIGHQVQLKLTAPLEGAKKWKGVLVNIVDGALVIEQKGEAHHIPLMDVRRGKLIDVLD